MNQYQLVINTKPKTIIDITSQIRLYTQKADIMTGLCHIFVTHTSCSLIISENYDPAVLIDLESYMSVLVSENNFYHHNAEGKDDMPAHIRTVLTQTSLTIPINKGQLALGAWQAIYLWEHRAKSHARHLIVTIYR